MADEEPGNLFSAVWKFLAKPITTWIGRQLPDAPKERIRRWWRNHVTKPKLAPQDRLSVVISKIYGDDAKETKRNRLIEATKKTGLAGMDPYRLDYCIWRPNNFSEADSLTQAREKAKHELSRLNADLLIFGMVDNNHFTLHFVTNAKEHSDDAQNIAFNLESGVELPADAGDLLKTIIETTFASAINQHLNSGDYIVEKLNPAISKLAKILASPPAVWSNQQLASLKIHYANCASEIGRQQGDATWFRNAIAAYEGALEEYTRERAPFDWAMTKNNLGNALQTLGERGNDEALNKAIAAYEDALEERSRERTPLDWATTKNNLGNALQTLGNRGDDEALKKAVAAYEDALEEYTRERAPLQWAMIKNNLGAALQTLGERGDDEALNKAIAAYEDALEERTRERAPLQWAATKNNLGNAFLTLGKRGDDEALKKAVPAYEDALEEYTRERTPLDWAMTTENLALAHEPQGDRSGDLIEKRRLYAKAIALITNTLEEFEKAKSTFNVVKANRNLDRIRGKFESLG